MKKVIFLFLVLCCITLVNAQKPNYTIKRIGVNTKYSDFGVSYYGENEAVFASSRRHKPVRTGIWNTNKQPYLQLFKGKVVKNGEIIGVKLFSKKLNTKYHESNVTFTKDLKTVYFSRNNYYKKKFTRAKTGFNLIQLYKARINKAGEWVDIQPMPFNNDNYQTGHPVLNADETKLYFTSDMPGSIGATDIYEVNIYEDGTYGEPKNLGPEINTVGKEMFPYIDKENVLYFSSDGYRNGKGGLDIYYVNLTDTAIKKTPKNLGYPINSNKDDFGFTFRKGMREGHFSSNRAGGSGDDDIYYFKELKKTVLEVIEEVKPIIVVKEKPCNQVANGVVKTKKTQKLLPGAKVELFDGNGKLLETTYADENAKFSFSVACKGNYKVVGTKAGYKMDSKLFTSSEKADLKLDLGLNLESLNEFKYERGLVLININMIYFDLNKSYIRPDARIELEKVLKVMKKYPKLNIELGSHTDSRGSDAYNRALSDRRAKSSSLWLINRGINPGRIKAKGYGETRLVNRCSNGIKCSKTEHQLNRRTEFVVLNPEDIN